MPKGPKRLCRAKLCTATHRNKNGYCDKHLDQATNWKQWQHKKGNRHARGYGKEWERIRERILSRDNYLCQTHKRKGRLKAANIVDHIIAKSRGGTDDDSNLEAICDECHKTKTARERLT